MGGAVAANALLGYTVDHFGWDGGFIVLTGSCVMAIFFFIITMIGEKKAYQQLQLELHQQKG